MPTTIEKKAAKILDKAADLIENVGWSKGWFVKRKYLGNGQVEVLGYCATGAIGAARRAIYNRFSHTQENQSAYWAAMEAVAQLTPQYDSEAVTGDVMDDIVEWNDRQTDKRKITRTMRRAARNLIGAK